MTNAYIAHTAELDRETRTAARNLLYEVFAEDMSENDWEHSLGGIHALVWEDTELIGHASVVQRRILHNGHALRAGYVEGVVVRSNRRKQGHGATMLTALEKVIRGAYNLGALGATDEARTFYAARGWQPWQGPTFALTPQGIKRTEAEDDSVYVLPIDVEMDFSGDLICDWREGDLW